ncbi:MAG: hypothetical protein FWF15_09850 [Oscillospiraceae bacterium]|nr:hypothetical protein [Oscillospiraceae bacterium]
MKKIFAVIIILSLLTIVINARTFNEPNFVNTDMHVNQMVNIGNKVDGLPVIYATVLQNFSEKAAFIPLRDSYSYRNDDIIYLYEKDMNFSVEANHIKLLNNVFSFSLNKVLADNEKVGVILDYGITTKFVTGKDLTFYYNQYSVSDVFADDYVNVKIVVYVEKIESNTLVRYGQVIEKYLIPSENPSSYNEIYSFRLPGQIGNTIIDRQAKIIYINVNNSVDITNLTPSVVHSPRASLYPASTVAQDFSKQIVYRIVAEDNTSTNYLVIVSVLKPIKPVYPIWPPVYPYPVPPIWPPWW